MFKPVPVAIGLRYLRAKRRNGFISFISMASVLGIAIGVAALITTLAVMTGFQREIRDRMLEMAAHATVSTDGRPMDGWREVIATVIKDTRVVGAAPYVETQGLITGQQRQPAILRGVLPAEEAKVSPIAKRVIVGSMADLREGSFNIILGRELAAFLGVIPGDKVTVMTDIQATPMGALPQFKRFSVSGLFEAGYQDYDKGMALANLHDVQRLSRMGEGVTGVRLKLADMNQAWTVARELEPRLNGPYIIRDWSSDHANMFRALKLEKTMMGILLSLIVAMGAFNLVSSQVMLVTDKQADIAILRTLGLTPRGVMRVFVVQGTLIGVIGTLSGVALGVLLTLNLQHILSLIERVFGVQLLPADVYYITGLPTELVPSDIVLIAVIALLMAFLATLYPAWRAARTAPAEALRYE